MLSNAMLTVVHRPHFSRRNYYHYANPGSSLMQTICSEWNCLAIEQSYCNTHSSMNPIRSGKALLMAKFQSNNPLNHPEAKSNGKEWSVLAVLPIGQRRVRGATRRLLFLAVLFVVYRSKVSGGIENLNGANTQGSQWHVGCAITVLTRNASKSTFRLSHPHALRARAIASKRTDSHIQSLPFPCHHDKHSEGLSTDSTSLPQPTPLRLAQRRHSLWQNTSRRTRHTQDQGKVNYPDHPTQTTQVLGLIPAQEAIGHRLSLIPQVGVLRMMFGRDYSPNLWLASGKVGPARVSVALYCCIIICRALCRPTNSRLA